MLDQLSTRLQQVFESVDTATPTAEAGSAGSSRLTEVAMQQASREIRRALLEADVHLNVVQRFLARVMERVQGAPVYEGLTPAQHLAGVVLEELKALLGEKHQPLVLEDGKLNVVLLFGLQGSGKTTTAAKLARRYQEEGRQVLLVAADDARPAAQDQLAILGERIGVEVVRAGDVWQLPPDAPMDAIVERGLDEARQRRVDLVIVDTAGRLQVDVATMADLVLVERTIRATDLPLEKLLVVDAMMGQQAVDVAHAFDEQLTMSGFIVAKLDADTRGGALLSVVETTGKPVCFIGTGETLEALEPFHPDRMASRILGMGDIATLFEKAQRAFMAQNPARLQQRLISGEFNIEDFLQFQQMFRRLGPLEQVLGMIPGLGGLMGGSNDMKAQLGAGSEQQYRQWRALYNSLTPKERTHPELFTVAGFDTRIARIAQGSGLGDEATKALLRQFFYTREMMQGMAQMMGPLFGNLLGGATDTPSSASAKTASDKDAAFLSQMSAHKRGAKSPGGKKPKPQDPFTAMMQGLMGR